MPPTRKPNAHRRRGKAAENSTVEAVDDGSQELLNSEAYCPATKAWFDRMAGLPQAALWQAGDWLILQDTAPLVCAYYCGELKYATEIRIRQAKLRVGSDDLAKAHVEIAQPEVKAEPQKPGGSRYGHLRSVEN